MGRLEGAVTLKAVRRLQSKVAGALPTAPKRSCVVSMAAPSRRYYLVCAKSTMTQVARPPTPLRKSMLLVSIPSVSLWASLQGPQRSQPIPAVYHCFKRWALKPLATFSPTEPRRPPLQGSIAIEAPFLAILPMFIKEQIENQANSLWLAMQPLLTPSTHRQEPLVHS
jgi:hypothetical protein